MDNEIEKLKEIQEFLGSKIKELEALSSEDTPHIPGFEGLSGKLEKLTIRKTLSKEDALRREKG